MKKAPKTSAKMFSGSDLQTVDVTPDLADQHVIDSLRDYYKKSSPPAAETFEIREFSNPKWAPLLVYFGTSTKLATFLGVPAQTLGRWIREENRPEMYYKLKVKALAEACKVASPY